MSKMAEARKITRTKITTFTVTHDTICTRYLNNQWFKPHYYYVSAIITKSYIYVSLGKDQLDWIPLQNTTQQCPIEFGSKSLLELCEERFSLAVDFPISVP